VQRLRTALVCALPAAFSVLVIFAILLVRTATTVIAALLGTVSTEAQATRTALIGQIAVTRKDLASQIEGARKDVLVRSDAQTTALRADVMGEVTEIRKPQTGDSATCWSGPMRRSARWMTSEAILAPFWRPPIPS